MITAKSASSMTSVSLVAASAAGSPFSASSQGTGAGHSQKVQKPPTAGTSS